VILIRSLFLMLFLFLAGCGGDPNKGIAIEGEAILNDIPLGRGMVIFTAQKGDVIRQANLDKEGKFAINDIPSGEYKVTVKPVIYSEEDYKTDQKGRQFLKAKTGQVPIPKKYLENTTSPLLVTVKKDEFITLELKSK
jgi:hypothetical protein